MKKKILKGCGDCIRLPDKKDWKFGGMSDYCEIAFCRIKGKYYTWENGKWVKMGKWTKNFTPPTKEL